MLKLFFFRTSNFYVNGGDLVVRGEWKEEQMEMDTGCGKKFSIAQLLSLMKLVMIESSKQLQENTEHRYVVCLPVEVLNSDVCAIPGTT